MPMTDGGSRPLLRSVGALVVLVVLMLGLPVLMARVARDRLGGAAPWTGIDPPWRWTFDGVRDTLGRPLGESALIDLLIRLAISVVWVAGVTMIVTIVIEVVHMRRHDGLPLPPVRGLGWSQRVARFVATGLLMLASFAGSSRVGASTVPLPVRSPLIATEHLPVNDDATIGGSSYTGYVTMRTSATAESTPMSRWRPYTVQPGDSVYGIAQRLAAPDVRSVPNVADQILDRNLGTVMTDGQRFTNAALIQPGWVLQVPDERPWAPRVADGAPTHVVQRGDTLSSIAERHLGSPDRWPEIWEANAGAALGGGRTFDDPDLIFPGWELTVPLEPAAAVPVLVPVAPLVDVPPVDAQPVDVPPVDVPPVDVPPVDVPPVDAPVTTTVTPATVTTTTVLAIPSPSASAATSPSPGEASVSVAPPPLDSPGATPDAEHRGPASPSPIGLGHAAMLSAGIVALAGVIRQRRLRAARPHARLPARSPEAVASERLIRSIDARGRLLRVDVALRAAAGMLAQAERGVVVVFAAPSGEVELVLTGSCELPAPWTGAGTRWTLPATVSPETLAPAARNAAMPCPALVQLGITPDQRDLFVDLEALGVLAVTSLAERADAVVAGIAATLGASPFAEVAHLIGVGIDQDALLAHRHRHGCGSVEESLALAAELIGAVPTAATSTFALRARMIGGESWEPAVVLVGSTIESDLDEVARLRPSQGVALVVSSPTHRADERSGASLVDEQDRWCLRIGGEHSEVFELTPIGLTPDELLAVSDLLADADDPTVSHERAEPDADDAETERDMGSAEANGCAPDVDGLHVEWSLLVRLLGPIDVVTPDRRTVAFERSKTRELIAWLSTHRERATRTAARTAMWELDVRDATFANVVSEARRAMARAVAPPEGSEWLGRTLTEQLPLHPNVRTDAEVLEHHLATARRQSRDDAIATLQPAVELIRGMPFEGTSYLWPDAEGLTSNLVLLATSAAAELAEHHLANGNVDGVFRATGQGLRVLPGHEELIALRMRAHARVGDMAGVRREWESYERVIHADPWSDGEPASKLVELRRELLSAP
jgi:LysM repeat protein/DNA-binding SARP family transcriptional activator